MRCHGFIILVFGLSILTSCTFAQNNSTKRCLIIAIGQYQHLRPISSNNDIPLIQSVLGTQGFTDFRILSDSRATRLNILNELTSLENDTREGDIVVIHFSAHGQGIPDDNGDEPDGIDESICCYGAEAYLLASYNGEEHLRDDELGEYLDRIRLKAGKSGQVLVLLDACYSGSGTRGDETPSRGVGNLLMKEGDSFAPKGNDDVPFQESFRETNSKNLAPLIVFSGSRADEKNFEYNGNGSLSYAFSKALPEVSGGKISYRSLFARINSIMRTIARYQFPVAEGNGLDLQVFNSSIIAPPPYFTITEHDASTKEVKISGGEIAGIIKGSKVAFYPAGILDTAGVVPAFTGVITTSTALNAVANCDLIPETFVQEVYWCIPVEHSIPVTRIGVNISLKLPPELKEGISEEIKKFKFIRLTDDSRDSDLKIIESEIEGHFRLVDAVDSSIILDSPGDISAMKNGLKQFARARLFESLNMRNEDIRLDLELIPVKFDRKTKKISDTLDIGDFYSNGALTVNGDDYFMMKIRNTGILKAYFNIIHINNNSAVDLIIPYMKQNEDPANYFIDTGDEFIIPNFLYKFPNLTANSLATSVIKVIASESPLDLRYAFMKQRGEDPGSKKGKTSILEEIIKMDDELMDRYGITAPADEMISTFTVTIRKRK